jgi:hypothetical protein
MDTKIFRLLVIGVIIASSSSYADGDYQRFIKNGDGTITDLAAGLMWRVCSLGQMWNGAVCEGTPSNINNLMKKGADYHYAGYKNWRVPTSYELESIVVCLHPKTNYKYRRDQYKGCDSAYITPTILSKIFPNTRPVRYWTSTISSIGFAESVSFQTGSKYIDDIHDRYAVRLVRDLLSH